MANAAILCLLAILSLFSGCLDDGSAPPATVEVGETSPPSEETETAPPTEETPATPPACPEGGQNNYGTWTQVGGQYIVSPYSGNLVVYYEESNGCNGLQSEEEWAHNPDTKIAEVPYPILDGTDPPANG